MAIVLNGTTGITTPGLDASGTNKFATTIGVGNATPSASGAGITFPATQNASSDANTLDDYEEGTFTPIFSFSGASVGVTYGGQYGTYTKVGNVVYFSLYVLLTSKGSSTGVARIGNLPFTSIPGPGGALHYSYSVRPQNCTGLSGGILALLPPSGNYIELNMIGTGSVVDINNNNISNVSTFILSGAYFTS